MSATGKSTAPAAAGGPSWRWRLWLLLFTLSGYCLLVLSPSLQDRIGILGNGVWFLDSYAILASSDAVQQGLDPARPNPLDVYQRQHSYSHWWFALRRLGLTRDDNFFFGGTMVVLFLAAAWLNLVPRRRGEMLWYLALLLSPPVLLAINRANNDLAVFALLGAGLWLAGKAEGLRPAWFGGAVALATGLKFFPVVAAGAAVVLRPVRRGLVWTAGLSLAALLVLASVRTDLRHAVFPDPIGTHIFGAAVIWHNLHWTGPGAVVTSLAVLTGGAVFLAARGWIAGLGNRQAGPVGEQMAFLAGSLVLLACFSAGVSYLYRWIFALWLAPWLWRQAWDEAPAGGRFAARLASLLLTTVMWADGLYCLTVNSLPGPMPPGRMGRWEANWNLLLQPVVWAFMLLLAGWLAGALRALWRDWRET
ncbi:MAG: hypothetical protein ACHQ5A_07085 [Opitutales bacterium]